MPEHSSPIDLDALFAPPTPEEIALVWESFPKEFRADRFTLLGEAVEHDGVAAQFLHYYSDGLKIYGVLHRPADTSRGPFPLLLANHGGFTALLFVRVRPPDAREVPLPARRSFQQWCADLARAGYVVLASGYRGQVTPLGQSDGHIEFGKGEVTDVLNLLECGKTLPYVDATRIGMWGHSHGAKITALAAQRSPDLRAGIVCAAPANISFGTELGPNRMRHRLEWLLRGDYDRAFTAWPPWRGMGFWRLFLPLVEGQATLERTRLEMIARTPYLFAHHTRCPLLLVCGDADDLYPDAVELDAALAGAGKEHEIHIFPGQHHGFMFIGAEDVIAEAWDLWLDFFARRLR
ncbi:MAG: prolyl oligopeptidase family serine peptidase [Dehalococcoidia bacterium]|nr:prolyl oligopeptidase family serine peptidase [Dehalococcoidia bacterium]